MVGCGERSATSVAARGRVQCGRGADTTDSGSVRLVGGGHFFVRSGIWGWKAALRKATLSSNRCRSAVLKRRGWRDAGGWGRTSCGPYLGKLLCSGRCLRPARAAPVLAWIGPCRNRRGNGSFRKRAVAAHSRTRFRSEPLAFPSFSSKVKLRLRSLEAVRRVIGYNASTMQT